MNENEKLFYYSNLKSIDTEIYLNSKFASLQSVKIRLEVQEHHYIWIYFNSIYRKLNFTKILILPAISDETPLKMVQEMNINCNNIIFVY